MSKSKATEATTTETTSVVVHTDAAAKAAPKADAKLAAIDAEAATAVGAIHEAEAAADRAIIARYAALGAIITRRYEYVTPKGDQVVPAARTWSVVAAACGLATVGSTYQGMSKASCERAWIASRDLNTEAKVTAWKTAAAKAKAEAATARAEAAELAADPEADEADVKAAKAKAKAYTEAASHKAYEATGLRSAVSYALAKKGNRIGASTEANGVTTPAPAPFAIVSGSPRGGTGASTKVDPLVTDGVKMITSYREAGTGGSTPIVGAVTAADIGEMTPAEAKRLRAIIDGVLAAEILATTEERAVADTEAADEAEAITADILPSPEVMAKADAKAALAAELAALAAKLDALA